MCLRARQAGGFSWAARGWFQVTPYFIVSCLLKLGFRSLCWFSVLLKGTGSAPQPAQGTARSLCPPHSLGVVSPEGVYREPKPSCY